ncbi:hypothetical protein C0J52_15353 [Blattella germanica]|nr:hypothetical protein C0J52_15353 [Blattella germanica]
MELVSRKLWSLSSWGHRELVTSYKHIPRKQSNIVNITTREIDSARRQREQLLSRLTKINMNWPYLLLLSTAVNCYPKLPCMTADGLCPSELECAINSEEDCGEMGNFKPNATDCGCCPACVKLLDRGEPCHGVEIPQLYECGDDLVCSERTGTCVPPSGKRQSTACVKTMVFALESKWRGTVGACAMNWGIINLHKKKKKKKLKE